MTLKVPEAVVIEVLVGLGGADVAELCEDQGQPFRVYSILDWRHQHAHHGVWPLSSNRPCSASPPTCPRLLIPGSPRSLFDGYFPCSVDGDVRTASRRRRCRSSRRFGSCGRAGAADPGFNKRMVPRINKCVARSKSSPTSATAGTTGTPPAQSLRL